MDVTHHARFHAASRTALVAIAVMAALASTAPVRAATLTWGTSGGGGNGTWDLSNSGWWNGSSQVQWNNLTPDDAVFAGTAGTVTLGANITTGTITATTTGYTINSSGANALTVSRIDISSLGASGQLNLGAKLTGNQALSLAGAGDTTDTGGGNANLGIRLTNSSNDFVGDITITNRLVSYTADAVFGNAANKIIMDGGGLLDNNASINLARDIEVRSGGGIIRFWNLSNATWSGALSGTGNIRRTDTGVLTLSGNLSTYSGTYTQVGSATNATIITGGGTVGGNWTVTSGTILFNSASNQTAGGVFSGSLVKSGAGTLTLTNGTVGGDWTVNIGGGLAIQSDSAQSMGGLVSGAGNLTKLGAGTLTMSARSTISGTVTVGAGTLRLNDARSMNGPAVVSSGATLTIENNNNGGYYQPSRLSLTTGTVNNVANGSNRYHGIYTGTIAASGGASSISVPVFMNQSGAGGAQSLGIDVATNASLTISGSVNNHPDQIGTTASVTKTGGGTLTLSGGNTFTGNMLISSGTVIAALTANNSSPSTTSLGNMTTNGRTITTSTGATLQFSQPDAIGQYNYSTPVTLIADGGTITRVSGSNTFNSIGSLTLQNGGRLTTTNGNAGTVGSFAINGNVTVQGTAGSFIDTLAGQTSNSYINLGTTAGSTTFTVAATGDPTADLTVSAVLGDKVLGGAAGMVKAGAGTMRISSANSYSGGTTLRAGTIVAANNNALSTAGTVTVNDASTGSSNTSLLIGGSFTIGRAISVANQGTGSVTIGSTGLAVNDQAVYSGAITLAKDVTLLGSGGDRTQFSGGIGGTGNVTVAGAGRTIFATTANTYAGTTTVNGTSTLQLGDGGSSSTSFLPDAQPVTVAGVLSLAKGGNSETIDALLGSGTVQAVAGADTLIVGNAGGSGTFSGVLQNNGGTLAFTKSGAGTQVLTGANTATGVTTITSGTLQVGNAGTTGSIVANSAVSSGAALAFSRSDGLTYSGTVSGAGNLVQIGTGTLTLSANNTYTGTTSLAAGVVSLGAANAIGTTGTISFTGGTLQYSTSNTTDYSNRFSTAAGQAFSIDTNGQAVSLGTALTSSGATLTKLGSGTLTLTANNTYSGATTVSAGVLRLGSSGGTGSVAGNIAVASGASLLVNRSDAYTLSNLVSGSGGLSQVGSGTTTLSNIANSYTGATTVSGGVLAVSTDLNLGAAPGSATPGSIVINGATLAFTSGFTLSTNRGIALGPTAGSGTGTIDVASGQTLGYGGVIANNGAGTDGLIKAGAGILALTGSGSYTGDTAVNAGTLQLGAGSSLASPLVTVASGATLSGRGTVNAVTVASGGNLTPGLLNSGTLTTGALSFSGAATVTMSVTGGLPSNLVNVLGNVSPSGGAGSVVFAFGSNLNLIGSGTWSLLTYTGTLSDASAFGYTGTQGSRQSVSVSGTTVANTVSLVVGNSFPVWSGTNGTDWFASDNWKLNPGNAPTNFQAGDTVEFNDLAQSGTVVISGSNAAAASTTFSGNSVPITVQATGGFGISGTAATVVKSGSALVTITNANTYGGGTTLSAGRIRVGDDAALGTGAINVTAPAALSSDGGTARSLANGLHLDADVTLGDATDNGNLTISGTVTFDGASRTITTPSNVTLSGLVTNGGLTKAGSGVLTITGSNNYANGTTLSAGTLRAGNDAALGVGSVALASGVALSSNGTNARTLTNAFTLNGDVTLGDATNTGALTIGAGGISLGNATRQITTPSNVTFAGAVTNGGITKAGTGTLTLAAANSYAVGTTLSAGDIALGNVAALGSGGLTVVGNGAIRTALTGTITNAIAVDPAVTATLEATSGVATYAGVVSGSGAVAKSGSGTVVLSSTSTYTGDTTISAGTLELGGAGQLGGGAYAGAIANAGTLSVASSANQTLSGVVSGVGGLSKAGAGTLTLSNASNSYSGGSTLTGGTVAFSSGALGSTGNVTVNNASLRWATGNTQDLSSRLVLVNSATATLDVGANNVTLASGFGAGTSGAVTKAGAGTLTLTGSSGYTGLTTVSTGTLQIGGGATTGSVAGDIATAATVAFNRSDAVTYAGTISGAGAVRQVGSGTLTLSGNNTFSGQLTVAQGGVAVSTVNNASANGPLGNSTNSVVLGSSGATGLLGYTGATNSSTKRFTLATGGTGAISVPTATTLTLSGSIDGAGAFVKQGPGTLALSGSSPFSGNMTIAGGTVNVSLTVNTSSPSFTSLGDMTTVGRTITVNSGATLNFVSADPIGTYSYKTPVTIIADGGTIFRSSAPGQYFNSLGDVELRNGGRLTTNTGTVATVQSYGLNGNVTVSGTSGSFIDTVGSSFTGINLGNNTGSYSGTTTFTVNSTGDPTADLSVSVGLADRTLGGASAFVKAGAGRMLMTGKSVYTGNTTINAGTFALGAGGVIYSGAYSSSVLTVGSGATLDLQNWTYNDQANGTASLGGLAANDYAMVVSGGTIRISGTTPTSYGRGVTVSSGGATLEAAAGATWTIDTVNDSFAWVYNSNPSITLTGGGTGRFDKVLGNGSGGLTKSGTGTWTLTGVNTFTGNTTISAGTLVLGGAGQLGGGTYGGTISNAGAFRVSTSANQTLSGVVSGVGSITKSGAGTLTLSNASNSFTGGTTITAGILSFASGGLGSSGTVTLGGGTLQWATGNSQDVSSRLALVNSTTTTLDVGTNDVTLSSGFGGGSSSALVKAGNGRLYLAGSNNFTGGTEISAGIVEYASGGLGPAGAVTVGNATLKWAAGNTDDISSRLTIANSSAATLDVGSNNVTLASGFGAGSNGDVTKTGAGTLTLSAVNGYTGSTTVSGGTLALAGAGSIASSSGVYISSGGLDISGASSNRTIGTLDGAAGSAVLLGGRSLTVNDGYFEGVINGTGGLTQAGGGTLTLTAVQNFTGAARVDAGTLAIGGSNTLATANRIFVSQSATLDATTAGLTVVDGQTLGGYGTVSGDVNFLAGAIVSPGGSIGNFTVNGGVTWSGTSGYKFEVTKALSGTTPGTDWDVLTATSLTILSTSANPYRILLTSLTNGGDDTPGLMSPGNWDSDTSYQWLFVDTANTITTYTGTNQFTFDSTGFLNTTNGEFSVVRGDSIGQSDTDLYIVYAAIPEPGTLVLAGIGLSVAGLAAFRRRRRPARTLG